MAFVHQLFNNGLLFKNCLREKLKIINRSLNVCFEKYIFIHASRSTDIIKPPSEHAVHFEEERSVCIFYKELKKKRNIYNEVSNRFLFKIVCFGLFLSLFI